MKKSFQVLKNSTIMQGFVRDERGSAYVLAALSMIPLFGMAALAIDYTNYDRIKSDLETAVDTAALHVAKRVALNPNMTSSALITEGKQIIQGMTPEFTVLYDRFQIEQNSGVVRIEAKANIATHFMHMFGHETLVAKSKSQAQFGRREVEVAIAIDNSGSMAWLTPDNQVRMTATKAAARTLIDTAVDSVNDLENASIKFSVIPWHTHVRLPQSQVQETNGTPKWWIDWDGYSTTHFRNLPPFKNGGDLWTQFPKQADNWPQNADDEFPYYSPNVLKSKLPLEADGNGVNLAALKAINGIRVVSRKNAFAAFSDEPWNRCFEHRAGNYRVSFDEPTRSNWQNPSLDPQFNGDSLFVPSFSPDEYDKWVDTRWDDPDGYPWARNDYVRDINPDNGGVDDFNPGHSDFDHDKEHLSTDDRHDRFSYDDILRARVNHTPKYVRTGTTLNQYDPWGDKLGPNYGCDVAELLPLSSSLNQVYTAIDNMQANGGTDLSIGLSWAMNTLTPWAPLEQAGSFRDAQKILVFMTDGDNSSYFPTGSSSWSLNYGSLGYMRDDPLGKGWGRSGPTASQANAALDDLSKEFCTAIKNRGVKIYFVYFGDASTNARAVASHCASTPDTMIIATNAAQLQAAFRRIGDDIGKLRLTNYTDPDE